jgi:lipid-binding SYLF domain-containing protein
VHIGGGTLGAQLGFQETDVLSVVTSDKAMDALAGGNFKVGADASATAGPVGTGRGTGTAVDTNADMLSYSRSKGLFAGAELNGSTIKPDEDARKALYGAGQDMHSILGGKANAPPEPQAQAFMNALRTGYGDGKLTPKS